MFGRGDLEAAKSLRDSFGSTKSPRPKDKKHGGAGNQSSRQSSGQRQPSYPPLGNYPCISSEYTKTRRDSYLASHKTTSGLNIGAVQSHVPSRQLDPAYAPSARPNVNQQLPHGHIREPAIHKSVRERSQNSSSQLPWQGQLVTSDSEFAAQFWKPPSSSASTITEGTTASFHSLPQSSHVSDNTQTRLTSLESKNNDTTEQNARGNLIDTAQHPGSGFAAGHMPVTRNFTQSQSQSQSESQGQGDKNYSLFAQTESPRIPEHPTIAQTYQPVILAFTRRAYKEGPEDVQMGGMDITPLPSKGVGLSGSVWNPQNTQECGTHTVATPADGTVRGRRPPSNRPGPIVTSGMSRGLGLRSSRWSDEPKETSTYD